MVSDSLLQAMVLLLTMDDGQARYRHYLGSLILTGINLAHRHGQAA